MKYAVLVVVVVSLLAGCTRRNNDLPLPDIRGHQFEKPFIADIGWKTNEESPASYYTQVISEELTANIAVQTIDGNLASAFVFYEKPSYEAMVVAYAKKIGREPDSLGTEAKWNLRNGTVQIRKDAVIIRSKLSIDSALNKAHKETDDTAKSL